jgi:hypothetical protein
MRRDMHAEFRLENSEESSRPTLHLNGEVYYNWDVFEKGDEYWTLSISRDGKVHLIPTDSIIEAAEIPRSNWTRTTAGEFASQIVNGELQLQLDKSVVGEDFRDQRLAYIIQSAEKDEYTVEDFREQFQQANQQSSTN